MTEASGEMVAELQGQSPALSSGSQPEDRAESETTFVPWLIVAAAQETPSVAAAPQSSGEASPDAEAYERHVGAWLVRPENEAAQQLWNDTVAREGGVAQRAHQAALEQAVERDEAGEPKRFPDLAGQWLGLVNAGGPLADRRRANNAAEVALSLVDTWLHGRPRAALPGTKEEIQDLTRLAADRQGLNKLEAALKVQGHGACAVVVQEWPHGEVHATTVHNQRGELVYVDAQRADQPLNAEPVLGAVRMGILAFGPEGKRIDIGG
ncbi:MAG TPA: toxin glutamine deamidase domain-containing protein [Candidatus Limnocylindrales bacterium]|nr:toxin glutamine deamidase domain-containing protein [Candidatus Limnocylindrales bacterium]